MGTTAGTLDYTQRIEHLEQEHQALKRQVSELHRRSILTPDEQILVVDLKKKKLAAKDEISGLKRSHTIQV